MQTHSQYSEFCTTLFICIPFFFFWLISLDLSYDTLRKQAGSASRKKINHCFLWIGKINITFVHLYVYPWSQSKGVSYSKSLECKHYDSSQMWVKGRAERHWKCLFLLQVVFSSTWPDSGFIYTSGILQQSSFASKALQAWDQNLGYKFIPIWNHTS